ncbi:glycosyltransferase [Bosea sp. TAF32]|uniref:glycosyltransferase n=1 Tax=Bosea sp. TAF32 TaxID=3237482 RepID=UPI003F8F9C61
MRVLICDPVCAQPFGHNAVQLSLFKRALRNYFTDVIAVCCKHLPAGLVEKHDFIPFYEFYYHDFLKLPGSSTDSKAKKRPSGQYVDELEAIATADAIRLIEAFGVGEQDTVVFPSVDFYGAIGFLNALAQRQQEQWPRILIRFIAVMEGASKFYRNAEAELIGRIIDARSAGVRMSFSAETPKLAERLSELLNDLVVTTPYPDVHDALPVPQLGPFEVFCPGSARYDKGFSHLLSIFSEVRKRDRMLNVRFSTQSLNPRDAQHNQNYISQLYAIPGVDLLPAIISDETMLEHFKRCSLVLLPYDRTIYELRGSAAMMEAVCFGRPIVTLAGTAFAEQIAWYRLGRVVESVSEVADVILEFSRLPVENIEARARRGRARFLTDVASGYTDWLGATL